MIVDTTYLLPLARIRVRTDLLRMIVDGGVGEGVDLSDIKVSLISLFELQAKASKLGVRPEYVIDAVKAVLKAFPIIPYYRDDIIRTAHEVNKMLNDYIDSIILATAITQHEPLVTEDSLIHSQRKTLEEKYGVRILRYADFTNQ